MKLIAKQPVKARWAYLPFIAFLLIVSFMLLGQGKTNAACSANYSYTISGLKVSFTADSSNGHTAKFTWNFGDGTSSHDRSPAHTYTTDGIYEVCMEVNDSPCSTHQCYKITVGHPKYCITGTVYAGVHAAYPGHAILYKYNPHDSTWNPVDTFTLTSAGRYEFGKTEPGIYMVKAMLDSGSTGYKHFLPTYYGNNIHWGDAKKIEVVNACVNGKDIHLHESGTHSGKGHVKGHASNGHKKMGADEGLEIQLLNDKDSIVDWTLTDAAGNFEFSNLAVGQYKVYAEFTGIPTSPAIITITDVRPDVPDIQINISQTAVTTGYISGNISSVNKVSVYPNPAGSIVNFEINCAFGSSLVFTISDMNGKVIGTSEYELNRGMNIVKSDISNLKSGIYFVTMRNSLGESMHTRIVKN